MKKEWQTPPTGNVSFAKDINRQQWVRDIAQSTEGLCLLCIRSNCGRTNNNNNFIQADRLAGTCHKPWCSCGRCCKTYSEHKCGPNQLPVQLRRFSAARHREAQAGMSHTCFIKGKLLVLGYLHCFLEHPWVHCSSIHLPDWFCPTSTVGDQAQLVCCSDT